MGFLTLGVADNVYIFHSGRPRPKVNRILDAADKRVNIVPVK